MKRINAFAEVTLYIAGRLSLWEALWEDGTGVLYQVLEAIMENRDQPGPYSYTAGKIALRFRIPLAHKFLEKLHRDGFIKWTLYVLPSGEQVKIPTPTHKLRYLIHKYYEESRLQVVKSYPTEET